MIEIDNRELDNTELDLAIGGAENDYDTMPDNYVTSKDTDTIKLAKLVDNYIHRNNSKMNALVKYLDWRHTCDMIASFTIFGFAGFTIVMLNKHSKEIKGPDNNLNQSPTSSNPME
jgi:hypothetical protein